MAILPGKRVRDNSIFGTLSGAMTSGSTSMASADLDQLSTIAGDHAIITIDPFRQFGDPEIVMVTSHPVGATSASIQRGMYFTVARSHGIGTQWAHAATVEDFADVVTSSTLPIDSFEGQLVYQTDTDSYRYFDGLTWRALGAGSPQFLGYTPRIANLGSITTSEVDLQTTVNVTVPAGRRIKVTAHYRVHSTTDNDIVWIRLKEDGITQQYAMVTARSSTGTTTDPEVILSPSAGNHTYSATAVRFSGAGTITSEATGEAPSFILVEDITGTETPFAGNSVPVGMLGQGVATSNVAGITTAVVLASTNVVVPAGRLLKVSVQGGPGATDGTTGMFGFIRMDGGSIGRWVRMNANPADSSGRHISGFVTISPSAGSHTFDATLEKLGGAGTVNNEAGSAFPTIVLVEDITPTPTPSSGAPSSTLGYAEVIANQGTFTAETDLTGLSVAVTVPAGRRIRIVGRGYPASSSNADEVVMRIKEGATTLQQGSVSIATSPRAEQIEIAVVVSPSSGTHTYKLSMLRNNGAGNITNNASATFPSYIIVEDITGAVWPQGSQVTSGIIASEAWTPFVPTVTFGGTSASIQSDSRYIKYGRTVHANFAFRITNLNAGSGLFRMSLPVAPKIITDPGNSYANPLGTASLIDVSTGNIYFLFCRFDSGSFVVLGTTAVPQVTVTSTAPITIAAGANTVGDEFYATLTYEAVS